MQFDRDKFKSAVHYICSLMDPSELGAAKLHKTLYFSDMLFYAKSGGAITGARYCKQRFGPVAPYLWTALTELESEGAVEQHEVDFYGFRKKAFIVKSAPDVSRLSQEEKQFIDSVAQFVCRAHTAREISELTHNAVWEAAEMGEEFPYYTALGLFPAEVDEEDIAWGIAEAEKIDEQGPKPR